MVRFFSFSQFHNKVPPAGSTHIRVNQLLKYWPEAGVYKFGENPEVLIFQKVYCSLDYQFPKHFEGIKILDICDPDWLNGVTGIKETADAVDAVTCPTESLAEFMRQLTDKPVVVIPDRFDVDVIPEPKEHKGKAKRVVWFGYSHNSDLLRPAIKLIEQLALDLTIISDDDPLLYRFGTSTLKDHYTFVKYKEETIYDELQKADFCILPKGLRPQDKFKSNNKTIKANLAGLPVAYDLETVKLYMAEEERVKFMAENYERIYKEYDVRESVKQYQELINQLS